MLRLTASRCLRQEWMEAGGAAQTARTLIPITKLRRRLHACAFSSTMSRTRDSRVFSQLAGNRGRFDVHDRASPGSDRNARSGPEDESAGVVPNSLSSEEGAQSIAEQHLPWDLAGHDLEADVHEIDDDKLQKVLSLLQSSADGSLESTLDALDLDLHEEFVVQLLETPFVTGESFIRFFKWARGKPGVGVTTREIGTLVRTISVDTRIRDAYSLWALIREIGEDENSSLSAEILNQLIAIFSKVCRGKAAMEVFNKFGDFGCVPDSDTFYHTIEALCRRSIFDLAWLVCEKMLRSGALPGDLETGNIITWLCKGNKAKEAHEVFVLAKATGRSPPRRAIGAMIRSLSRDDGTLKLAREMLCELSGGAQKYAIKPFTAVVGGLCRVEDMDEARRLVHRMVAEGPPPGKAVFNLVITGYSKREDMGGAMEMLNLMKLRGLRPDLYTYTVIMSGYAGRGEMENALTLATEAKKKHPKLNRITYHVSHSWLLQLQQFDRALELLSEMRDFGVEPNGDEYNKLIRSLCFKALNWEAAEKLLGEMKQNGMHLSAHSRALVRSLKELEEEAVQS